MSLRRNPLIVVLGVAAVALAAVLAAEVAFFGGERAGPAPKPAVAQEAKLLPPVPTVVPDQAYSETVARPIFVPTRRPAPAVAVAAAPAFQRGQFTLHGVIVAGNNRTAMLREKSSGRVHRVEAGKEVNGIKVVQIEPTVVTLGMGEERETVALTVQKPGGAPGAPGAPQAAAAPPPSGPGGPFGAPPSPFPAPGAPPTAVRPAPGQPPGASPFPRAAQPPAAGAPPAPTAPTTPQATTAPMTPEELLARRRARRAQQNQ